MPEYRCVFFEGNALSDNHSKTNEKMRQNSITISENFKKTTSNAILSIVLFVFIYLLLIVLAVGLTVACTYGGIMFIAMSPSIITIMLGLGVISMGFLILAFLLKFVFAKHKVDRSHLVEVTREQEPGLFKFIGEIVKEVETDFPKKVFLSADVNAAVFYDSSFWSMFFPIKKNLQIGIGLVNSVSVSEFKAILAHEFGHFSQRTMKVGSYVYNVNQVIYNLLNENQSYNSMAQQWASVSGYFTIFVNIAVTIIRGIQWILQQVYEIVNFNYMSLSREMEFHADEVAANVAGSAPLATSLLRLDLADQSYHTVLNYYSGKISESIKTNNIYPQQRFVMELFARDSSLPIENDLPQVSIDHLNRYNKSKLVVKNQWASHPSTPDRVEKLNQLNIVAAEYNAGPASEIFQKMDAVQEKITSHLYAFATDIPVSTVADAQEFMQDFAAQHEKNSFNKRYNNYYDDKNPEQLDLEALLNDSAIHPASKPVEKLFGNEAVEWVYTAIALQNDRDTLLQISKKNYKIKTFDYDGVKYTNEDCDNLIQKLDAELDLINARIHQNDIDVFLCFHTIAKKQGKADELIRHYEAFFKITSEYPARFEQYKKMLDASDFVQSTNHIEVIENKIMHLNRAEKDFKTRIEELLKEEIYQGAISPEIRQHFTDYLSKDWMYFFRTKYDDDALNVLFTSINDYRFVLSETFFALKKELLDYQAGLVEK